MRRILMATSALVLFGASAGFAQELQSPDMSDESASPVMGEQGVDTSVTTGSVAPLRFLNQGFQATDDFKPSDDDDLPDGMAADDLFDNEIDPGADVAAAPFLRPIPGSDQAEMAGPQEENDFPEAVPQ
ncbi:hypothetical protein [Chelativorans sp.]|uniref:hypothetical protein n=1 Tax=Chelativorans sp. TaxID=2203393 RepID=UPI002811913C|nr:hypothetical protein [Chelativorans sp.]